MGKTNTKKMVQGAMIAAIFGVLSLFNTYTGSLFDIVICYVMVVPLVWYGYNYTLKDNLVVSFVSMIVIAMVGLPFFVISSISSCLAGLFIGEALKRKAKKETILLGTFGATFFNNILLYEVFAGLLDMDLVAEMTEIYQMMLQMMPSLSQKISLDFFLSFIPMILIIMSALEMYVIVLLCQVILYRLKIEFPGSFHIASMHIGKKAGLVLLVLLVVSYFLQNVVHIQHLYLNYLYILCMIAFALEGLAVLSWIMILLKKPIVLLLITIGIIIPGVNIVYAVIGIIDIFSDLRGKILYNNHIDK